MMFYQDKDGQLNFGPKEDKDIHKYHFAGNAYINDILVGWVEMTTYAVSLKQAINNIKHRIKKRFGHGDSGTYVNIDASQVKEEKE